MSTRLAFVALVAAAGFASIAAAQAPRPIATVPAPAQDTSVAHRLQTLERQVDSLRDLVRRQASASAATARAASRPEVALDMTARPATASGAAYVKPFVHDVSNRVALGGWADFEFRQQLTDNESVFDQPHLVPYVYARITDQLRVGAEVELDHAPTLDGQGSTTRGTGDVVVDFATVDYTFARPFSLRGGVILSPLGRFNLQHDAPQQDLTARPLLTDAVLPGILGETGVGAFGSVEMSPTLLSYELYAVNGFTGALLPANGATELTVSPDMVGTRGAVESSTKNVVGRLAFSPFRGFELGGSAHWGPYGDGVTKSTEKHDALLWAVDGAFDRGFVVARAEMASLKADLPAAVAATGASSGRQGYYGELGFRFGGGWLPPYRTSGFTIVGRWDEVDLATGITGDMERRASAGLVWRPIPIAAFKGSYEMNWVVPSGATTMVKAPSRLLFSAATYF